MIEIPPVLALLLLLVIIGLFFWAIAKAVKTQKKVYIFAMMPFILLLIGMFFI
ncbi:hypothetical protein [Sulfurovum sp.]|uniref:hypothetical protein n=1 Tax=Sulfurovum sp. TaxID=1969726 RepID=UPI002868027A|nr:hypothetical protein [Sulfurovum sp.]